MAYAGLLHRRLVTVPRHVSDKMLCSRSGYTVINNIVCYGPWNDIAYTVPEAIQQSQGKKQQKTETETLVSQASDVANLQCESFGFLYVLKTIIQDS